MRIGVVAPRPAAPVTGGTERLVAGLVRHLDGETTHACELVTLPVAERSLPDVVAAYRAFARLDVSRFDAVVSTKYPSWMIDHPHHVCYMVHRLRGLYDTYPSHLPARPVPAGPPGVADLVTFLERHAGRRDGLPEAFDRIERVLAVHAGEAVLAFPGPLARAIVGYLDGVGLSGERVRRFAAISATVAARVEYFPAGVEVAVAHPPPMLARHDCRAPRHFFTASRLDGPKRLDLVVEAMSCVQADIPLVIAGEGPEHDRLARLAAGDTRVELRGWVGEDELVDLYAHAVAVPFVPYREDLGLVTIEAMACAKPVVTCSDSEGSLEFVEDEVTGLVAAPRPGAIGARLNALAASEERAHQMGLAARDRVAGLSWAAVACTLFGPPSTACAPMPEGAARSAAISTSRTGTPRLAVATTFPVWPPRNGGQHRAYHLFRQLPVRVTFVSLANPSMSTVSRSLGPTAIEHRIAQSPEHANAEAEMSRGVDWIPVTDIAMASLYGLTPAYLEALDRAARASDVVVAVHPYVLPALRDVTSRPLWYEAQDFQLGLKRQLLPDTPAGRALVDAVRAVEGRACHEAELVMVCSRKDAAGLAGAFALRPDALVVVPNGVDLDATPWVTDAQRHATKRRLGLAGRFVCLFVGSWHGPNLEAVGRLREIAPTCPDATFVVVGSVGWAFASASMPPNVVLLNEVDVQTKRVAFESADVAINPVTYGTGSNLKMLEYAGAGVPIVSTAVGVREFDFTHGCEVEIAAIENFALAIRRLQDDPAHRRALADRAARVAARHDWRAIARAFADARLAPAPHSS
jgi:glycosyltransferase involved in cell wall biosynthesis